MTSEAFEMENVPDDLMAAIFSYLCPQELCSTIPLVCKRWYQLAKHPDSWRYVDLTLPPGFSDAEQKREFGLIAKHAPYLRCVDLEDVMQLDPDVDAILKALMEGNKTVKVLKTFSTTTKRMRLLTKQMIEKFATSLRELALCLEGPDHLEPNQMSKEFCTSVNKILTRVSELPNLNSLTLDFINLDDSILGYKGQLGKGCPMLRKLKVVSIDDSCNSQLLLDLLQNKKDVLEVFSADAMSPDIEAALRNCVNLVECGLPFQNIGAIAQMSHLHGLEIYLTCVHLYSTSMMSAIENFIKSSGVIGNIRKLTLSGLPIFLHQRLDLAVSALDSLAQKCKNVETFRLTQLEVDDQIVNSFLANLDNVQHISLGICLGIKTTHISKLCGLSKLRSLQISSLKVRDKAELEAMKTAFKNLQEALPKLIVQYLGREPFEIDDSDEDDDDYGDVDGWFGGPHDFDYDDDYNFTYFDYLRNKYGEDLSDQDLYALMSSDED